MSRENKKPITIVTGCLGSGKTTLLQNILKAPELSESTGVIVNEFGKVGLDHHLLRKADEKTILLSGGCICCNSREDLEQELKSLLYMDEKDHKQKLNRVIIETTGLADPAPILFTIATNPILQHHFYIDCVITTVDAENGLLQIKNSPELIKQVTVADKIVLTKTDIAKAGQLNELKNRLKEFNPSAEFIEVIHGNANPKIIEGNTSTDYLDHIKNVNKPIVSDNNSNIQSISFTFSNPLNWTAFGLWLSMLLHANGENVLRVKGLLDVGEKGPIVLNGVQHIIHPPDHLKEWPDEERLSHLIFILRSIEPDAVSTSLKTFQRFLGTEAELLEVNSSL
ncbi:cobalamin biosynthesis protein CobW [Pueribacillus theae]|uniref:Cobalamin biosynthesis protein CobW n=1 Tax=Pueribacillus theae TaxID=2171751 RepID=A0A2U1K164_9BACI|nr:GTP-binding protein [Pueribacillus theae]PWA11231.1 cobalamin biosynthesis protein CobW [Pueribacillus theae]